MPLFFVFRGIGMYDSLTLEAFLAVVLKAYPDLLTCIKLLTDGVSPEYKAFHAKTVSEHVTLLWLSQRGLTYQVNRVSDIRDSTGQGRYVYNEWDADSLESTDINIAYRLYKDQWYPWVTVKLT